MNDTARDSISYQPVDTKGLDDLFANHEQGSPEGGPVSEEPRTHIKTSPEQFGTQDGPGESEVSAEVAAATLGISVRAVLKRLNKGSLRGRKIATKFGEKWFLDKNELPSTVFVEMVEQESPGGGPVSEEPRTEEGTGSGQGGTQDGPKSLQVAQLMANALSNQSELVATIQKQTQIIELITSDLRRKDEQLALMTRLLTDSQQKQGWWQGFCSWFMGQKT